MGKDEEPGDNVMHRGAELEGRRRRKSKQSRKRRESTGCVHLALGGRGR